MADAIDYRIIGEEMQAVVITLDPQETVTAEAGAMLYMTEGIEMSTALDASGQAKGLFGKLLTATKRALTGESFFITTFANVMNEGRAEVGFSAPYPGKIVPIDLAAVGGEMLCQKDSFLCAAKGIDIGIAFTKRIGAGFFGGEGFILQRLKGDGLVFIHAGGSVFKLNLVPGQNIRVDTGCLVAFEPSVDYDIKFVGSIKTAVFGGEGLFFASLTGPGTVYLQTLPFSRLADRIIASAPSKGGKRRGEGSILGGIGALIDGN